MGAATSRGKEPKEEKKEENISEIQLTASKGLSTGKGKKLDFPWGTAD